MTSTPAVDVQSDPRLPSGWAKTTFGAIYELQYGKRLPERFRKSGGQYKVYGSNGCVGYHDKFLVDGPTLVVGRKGTVGHVSLANDRCWPIDTTYYIPSSKHIDIHFSHLLLSSLGLDHLDRSTAIPSLNRNDAYALPVNLPPLAEQRRIASRVEELFGALNHGTESLKTAQTTLGTYQQSVLKHAFDGRLTERWRTANSAKVESRDQLIARVKRECAVRYAQQLEAWRITIKTCETGTGLGKKPSRPKNTLRLPDAEEFKGLTPLPDGYAYTYLANLGELGRGRSQHRPRNDPRLFGSPYPFIQTSEVKRANRVIREHFQEYNEIGLAQSRLWPKGTLCITIAANIAETAVLGFDGCFPDSIVGFSATESLVSAEYIELFLESAQSRIESYAPATAQKNINLKTLKNLVVPLCSLEEQRVLVGRLERILLATERQGEEVAQQLTRAEALRRLILNKALSGQLVSQDMGDEPASALLERIRLERKHRREAKRGARAADKTSREQMERAEPPDRALDARAGRVTAVDGA